MAETLIGVETCSNCKFAFQPVALHVNDQYWCRRYPPHVTGHFVPGPGGNAQVINSNAYPTVEANQWCAEHKRGLALLAS